MPLRRDYRAGFVAGLSCRLTGGFGLGILL